MKGLQFSIFFSKPFSNVYHMYRFQTGFPVRSVSHQVGFPLRQNGSGRRAALCGWSLRTGLRGDALHQALHPHDWAGPHGPPNARGSDGGGEDPWDWSCFFWVRMMKYDKWRINGFEMVFFLEKRADSVWLVPRARRVELLPREIEKVSTCTGLLVESGAKLWTFMG